MDVSMYGCMYVCDALTCLETEDSSKFYMIKPSMNGRHTLDQRKNKCLTWPNMKCCFEFSCIAIRGSYFRPNAKT